MAAIHEAGHLMTGCGFESADRDAMLQPVLKIVSETDWTAQEGSLVVFSAPGFIQAHLWPGPLAPRVHFGQEFLIVPLLTGFQSARDFWLLALSIKRVRLFRGSDAGLTEVALPEGLATSLAGEEAFDRPDHSLRGRSSAGPSVGGMKGVQFGTSSAREHLVDYLHDYFRAIDRGIRPILAADMQPLILAAVSRELAIYRKVNTYSLVLAGDIHGNPDSLGVNVLYGVAADLIAGYSARPAETILAETEAAASRGLAITDPLDVAKAASAGQVQDLIVWPEAPHFDRYQDAVNRAVLSTIRHSGRISVLTSPLAIAGMTAILRFRLVTPLSDEIHQSSGDEVAHRQ